MKKLLPLILVALIVSCEKESFYLPQTTTFSIQSSATGALYPIQVSFPEGYSPADQTYRVLYVLDGEENFAYVAGNCKTISAAYATSDVIVVAIGYGNDRALDYTPTVVNQRGGGAENFMRFLKEDLIPRMEHDYAADTLRDNRIILGHSYGGLLAAYAFTQDNAVFGSYLMLSPSIWYDNEIILKLEQENRDHNREAKQRVFMGLGSLESNGRMMAPFEALYQRLANQYPNMKITRHIEPQLDHMGSRNPNILEGLNFYFQNR